MSKLRLIQCGVGGWGKGGWRNAVASGADFELVAIVDLSDEALQEAGDAYEIAPAARFHALPEAIQHVSADAVLTVTPPTVHLEHARLAFDHGLHLLTEKPIAHDLASARMMVELAHRANRQLMVAQNYRYSAPMQRMMALLSQRTVGELGHGHMDFYIPADLRGTFRQTMQFPLLVDMTIHHIDLIRAITAQNIRRVTAHTFNPAWSWFDHHAALKMLLELDDGMPFSYSGDWSAHGRCTTWNGDWRLQCAEGSIHLQDDKLTIGRCDKWAKNAAIEKVRIPAIERTGQAALLHNFAVAIHTRTPAETSGLDNLQSFAAVIAATISSSENRTVDVAQLLTDTRTYSSHRD